MEEHKERKWLLIVLIIILIVSCGVLAYNIYTQKKESEFNFNDLIEKDDHFDKSSFNFFFTSAGGSEYKASAKTLIDHVIKSNNGHPKKLITVVYGDESSTDVVKLQEFKNKIEKASATKFNVMVYYDDDGYVNKTTITEEDITADEFNRQFFIYREGKQMGAGLEGVLTEVNDSNRKYSKHKITVVFGKTNTTDEEKIKGIRKSIETFVNYDLSYDYDEAGYISKVTIERV